jgi:hypothetical protein
MTNKQYLMYYNKQIIFVKYYNNKINTIKNNHNINYLLTKLIKLIPFLINNHQPILPINQIN